MLETCQINIGRSNPYPTLSNSKPQFYSLMLLFGTKNDTIDKTIPDIALDEGFERIRNLRAVKWRIGYVRVLYTTSCSPRRIRTSEFLFSALLSKPLAPCFIIVDLSSLSGLIQQRLVQNIKYQLND